MEKQTLADENDKAARSISFWSELLNDESFKDEHRTLYKFFTRKSFIGLCSRPAR
jgi:hypothetical protein